MTKQDAIKWLRFDIEMMKFDPNTGEEAYLDGDAENVIKALDMAIEALSCSAFPNRSDLISRQDAVALLEKWSGGYEYIETETESAIKELCDLPSAQPDLSGLCDRLWKSAYDRGYERCKQDAIDAFEKHLDYLQTLNKDENPTAESKWYGVNWARNTIADLPSAQPEQECEKCIFKPFKQFPERKKGHWIKISPANIYECSECGKNVMTDDISAYDFCHGCGAEMEGEKDE